MPVKNTPFIPTNACAGYLINAALFLILFIYPPGAFAAAETAQPHKNIFEQVRTIPAKERADFATALYKKTFRKVNGAIAMANLDSLDAISIELGDKTLQCRVYNMRADYYSYNHGLNLLSTDYYQKAINFAAENDMPLETAIGFNNMGRYLFIFKQYAKACRYFLQSQEKFREIGYENVPEMYNYLWQVADFYYALGDYDNAKANLEQGLRYAPATGRDRINMTNTIGLIYRNNKQYPQALSYFNKAIKDAIASKDTIWTDIVEGNIGSVYFLQGNYAKAEPYIETDYTASVKYKEPINGAIALLRLIKINIDEKNYKAASRELNTITVLIKNTKEDVLGLMADYYDLKAQLYELLGNPALALAYRKTYELDKDSLIKRNNLAAVERVKLRYETDRRSAQLSKAQAIENVQKLKINAVIAVLILLVIISVLLYNRQRIESKKDKALLMAEKRVVDEGLKNAENALRGFTENLRQKNVLIENFKTEIDNLNQRSAGEANAGNLEKLLQAHIMTDQNWGDFKKLFAKVYPGFFVNISKNYPQLSATDTRMLALIKLGLNNPEMANMLGITVEGIKKAKQRLRKKIDIHTINDVGGFSDV